MGLNEPSSYYGEPAWLRKIVLTYLADALEREVCRRLVREMLDGGFTADRGDLP